MSKLEKNSQEFSLDIGNRLFEREGVIYYGNYMRLREFPKVQPSLTCQLSPSFAERRKVQLHDFTLFLALMTVYFLLSLACSHRYDPSSKIIV